MGLSPEQKQQYKKLWARLNGDTEPSGDSLDPTMMWMVLAVITALLWYWSSKKPSIQEVGSGQANPIPHRPFSEAAVPLSDEAREARLRRFATPAPEGSTPASEG